MSHQDCLDALQQAADLATREEYRGAITALRETIFQSENRHAGMDAWGERDRAKAEQAAADSYGAIRHSGWAPTSGHEPGGWSPFRKLRHRTTEEIRHVHEVDARELMEHPTEGANWEDITFTS